MKPSELKPLERSIEMTKLKVTILVLAVVWVVNIAVFLVIPGDIQAWAMPFFILSFLLTTYRILKLWWTNGKQG